MSHRRHGASPGATAPRVCAFCAAPIADSVYARSGRRYCCEDCYLKEREFLALAAAAEHATTAFAEALVTALDLREHETGLHSRRVACHTVVLARRFIDEPALLMQVYWGALLHDVGKIGVADAILLKTAPLTGAEWAQMRAHPEKGAAILAGVPTMSEARDIVLAHEERYDGSGYPRGLAGEAIPLGARLFAVIDTLDAMTNDRPYRPALGFDAARAEIERGTGTQFDPRAVAAFFSEETALREMVALKCGEAGLPDSLLEST